MDAALIGIIICTSILVVIFTIQRIMTYPVRHERRFKKRTSNWKIGDRIVLHKYNTGGDLKPDETIYKLVGWNIKNFAITDLSNNIFTLHWSDYYYRNITAENRLLHNNCAADMGTEPGFKINDNETKHLYP